MFTAEIYSKRRAELRRRVGQGLILLPGNVESPLNYPNNAYHFRQDSTFLYFFAKWEDGAEGEFEVLFAPRNTNDGAAEDESEDEVCKSYLPPTEQYPKDVEYYL